MTITDVCHVNGWTICRREIAGRRPQYRVLTDDCVLDFWFASVGRAVRHAMRTPA